MSDSFFGTYVRFRLIRTLSPQGADRQLTSSQLIALKELLANPDQNTRADADTRGVDFSGQDLSGVDFSGVDIAGATFRDAILRGANFKGARGVSVEAFGGADLENARFDDGFTFPILGPVSDISSYLQTIFKIILVTCTFALLTVLSTRDEDLILHNARPSTQVPFIQANVSAPQFAWILPTIVFVLFAYLLYYLASLWQLISYLPAVFPDGTALDRRVYPLLLNCLIRKNLHRLEDRPPIRLQIFIAYMLIFGVPLFTFLAFWVCSLKLHWWRISLVQVGTLACAIGLTQYFIGESRRIMRGQCIDWGTKRSSIVVVRVVVDALGWGIFAGLLFTVLTWLVFRGDLNAYQFGLFHIVIKDKAISNAGRGAADGAGGSASDTGAADGSVNGADLGEIDLRGVDGFRAYLAKAYLCKARLNYADLRRAELQGADLRDADLSHAKLAGANLTGALLQGAVLTDTTLAQPRTDTDSTQPPIEAANVQYARFERATLPPASRFKEQTANYLLAYYDSNELADPIFSDYIPAGKEHNQKLEQKDLARYKFTNLDLTGVDFRRYRLREIDFRGAKLLGADFREADIEACDFNGADLSDSKCQGAKFVRSDFTGARLRGANFCEADLHSARNLTVEMKCSFVCDKGTALPDGLVEELRKEGYRVDSPAK